MTLGQGHGSGILFMFGNGDGFRTTDERDKNNAAGAKHRQTKQPFSLVMV